MTPVIVKRICFITNNMYAWAHVLHFILCTCVALHSSVHVWFDATYVLCTYICYVCGRHVLVKEYWTKFFKINKLKEHTEIYVFITLYTVLPQIMAKAFISFQQLSPRLLNEIGDYTRSAFISWSPKSKFFSGHEF